MNCLHCGTAVYRDGHGAWIDETEGDGCVTDVHEPDLSRVDGYVFECDCCNFYGENTERVCPSCEADIPENHATPFCYAK
jgi:hypothetical protein